MRCLYHYERWSHYAPSVANALSFIMQTSSRGYDCQMKKGVRVCNRSQGSLQQTLTFLSFSVVWFLKWNRKVLLIITLLFQRYWDKSYRKDRVSLINIIKVEFLSEYERKRSMKLETLLLRDFFKKRTFWNFDKFLNAVNIKVLRRSSQNLS